ncbi:MAG: gliding motility associated protein GldN [Saprospiraceae bacterium]|jgi:gliding motility associated protien GldN|tara:strand:+ start:272 stop:1168 length:897 start_codon:yes stop_codon:yes gene_type:complete
MNNFLKYTFFFSLLLGSIGMSAQIKVGAEDIITESSEPAEDIYVDDIVVKRLITENRVLQYEPIREADIAWQKTIYRVIETREKMNLAFRSPVKPFFEILRDLSMNGDITLFKHDGVAPDYKSPFTAQDVEDAFFRTDTVSSIDYDTYEETVKINKSEVFYEDVNRFRIKEIWFFDEEASMLKVRILGVAPVIDRIDPETGVVKYPEVLFWIYYPTARELLSKHRVVNDNNDIAPMTWADLFESRFFASYIYKITNVLDKRVQDNYSATDERSGINALLESEQIKAELFNFEHDLWEY